MIGVGVVGTGFGRFVHVPAWQATPGATVVGIASGSPGRAAAVAAQVGSPCAFDSWQDLVASPEVQIVSIATPPATHAEIVLAALAQGKAVLCEKPLALSLDEARRIAEAARAARLPAAVDFGFREIREWRQLRTLLRAGAIGRLREIHTEWVVSTWADPERPASWKTDSRAGGGALGALGVHALDAIEWFFGPIAALTAQTASSVAGRKGQSEHPSDAEDCCHLLIELRGGTPVSVVCSSIAWHGVGHRIACYGDSGVLVLSSPGHREYARGYRVLSCPARGGALVDVPLPEDLAAEAQEDAFDDGRIAPLLRLTRRLVAALSSDRYDVTPSFEEGLRAQVLLDAVARAAAARRWIDIPPPKAGANAGPDPGPGREVGDV
jgi:predicted dehydrogenase